MNKMVKHLEISKSDKVILPVGMKRLGGGVAFPQEPS